MHKIIMVNLHCSAVNPLVGAGVTCWVYRSGNSCALLYFLFSLFVIYMINHIHVYVNRNMHVYVKNVHAYCL